MLTILDALDDHALFGAAFAAPTWQPWRVFLAALFGLPMTDAELATYRECTGREVAPAEPAMEGFAIVGRRGGKSLIAALVAVYLACLKPHRWRLGERGVCMIIASDRRQARVIMNYIGGLLDGSPMLSRMVRKRAAQSNSLRTRSTIEVH